MQGILHNGSMKNGIIILIKLGQGKLNLANRLTSKKLRPNKVNSSFYKFWKKKIQLVGPAVEQHGYLIASGGYLSVTIVK